MDPLLLLPCVFALYPLRCLLKGRLDAESGTFAGFDEGEAFGLTGARSCSHLLFNPCVDGLLEIPFHAGGGRCVVLDTAAGLRFFLVHPFRPVPR